MTISRSDSTIDGTGPRLPYQERSRIAQAPSEIGAGLGTPWISGISFKPSTSGAQKSKIKIRDVGVEPKIGVV